MNFSHNLKCCIIIVIQHLDEAKKQPVVAYHRSPAHVIQVQLYMYLLPRSCLARWRDTTFEGTAVYAGGHQVDVPANSIDDAFIAPLAAFMQKMTSDMPPRRVPRQIC